MTHGKRRAAVNAIREFERRNRFSMNDETYIEWCELREILGQALGYMIPAHKLENCEAKR